MPAIAIGRTAFIACFVVMMFGLTSDRAAAQSACIDQCRDQGWARSQCARYCETRYGEPSYSGPKRGERVYGYTGRAGSCGQYKYMRTGKCVDARITPATGN